MNLWIWVFSTTTTGVLIGLFKVTSSQLAGQKNYLFTGECWGKPARIAQGVR
jgi:hypothetical protein